MGEPTSLQYALGVEIGHLIVAKMRAGMTYDEVIDTLAHVTGLAIRNREFGISYDGSTPILPTITMGTDRERRISMSLADVIDAAISEPVAARSTALRDFYSRHQGCSE